MTVRELIAELSEYPPEAEIRLETQEGSTGVEKIDCYAGRVVKLFDGDTIYIDECDECGELIEDCDCDDHEPFHVESSDSFDPRSDDTDD